MSDKTLHLIDTCVLVNIRDVHNDSDTVWSVVYQDIEMGILKTVRQVAEELESRFPDFYQRIKPYKKKFLIPDGDTYAPTVAAEIRALHSLHPKLYRQLGGKNPADPWLIAVAKSVNAVVLTDKKNAGKGHTCKIPWVCKNRNVGCMNGATYFKSRGLDV